MHTPTLRAFLLLFCFAIVLYSPLFSFSMKAEDLKNDETVSVEPRSASPKAKTTKTSTTTRATEGKSSAPKVTENGHPFSCWIDPLNPPRAALLCIHGLGLNSDAYRNFGLRMSRRGVATYAIDVRGFGTWMKGKGTSELDFTGTIEDVEDMIDDIRKLHPGLPVFLLGESMGGAIALRVASLHPEMVSGLISAVPAGDRFQQKKQELRVAVRSLAGPGRQFNIGSAIVEQATNNKVLAAVWESDPLNRMNLSPAQLMHFQRFMNENIEAARKIKTIPVLVVQGTLDKLVRPEGTWQIFTALAINDKALIAFPSEHLIFEYTRAKSDFEAAKAAQVAANWIYEHIPDNEKVPVAYTAMNSRLFVDTTKGGGGKAMAVTPDAFSPSMEKAMLTFATGDYKSTVSQLEKLLETDTKNFRARLWLSLAYDKCGNAKLAQEELFRAREVASGADQVMRANQGLLQLFDDPAAQPDLSQVKAEVLACGKPTVLMFGAPWCAQSNDDEALLSSARKQFGDSVQFKRFNLEEKADKEVAGQFSVGPLPTCVFVSSEGKVKFSQYGQISPANFNQAITALLK